MIRHAGDVSLGRMKTCGGFETLGSRVCVLGLTVSVAPSDLVVDAFLARVFMLAIHLLYCRMQDNYTIVAVRYIRCIGR